MKKNIGKLIFFCLLSFLFSQEIDVKPEENLNDSSEVNKVAEESTDSENNTETENIELEDESQKETSEIIISHKPGVSEVPEEKRPKTPSDERIKELDSTGEDNREKNTETLKFGMESDILDLLDELIKNEDVRFVNEVYDLFKERNKENFDFVD